jgi:hypothetical protein
MKKPGVISFTINFGRDQRSYKHISLLSHNIGLLYSIHLKLIWEKYKDIRLVVYDGEDEEITTENYGYKTRAFITTSRNLTKIKVYKPDKIVKLKILELLQEIIIVLSKEYSWNQDSVQKAYDEVKKVVEKGEPLPSYLDTFFGENSWKASS